MNTKLLEKVRDHIAAEPDSWTFQWFNDHECGTRACIGGRAMLLSGISPRKIRRPELLEKEYGTSTRAEIAEKLLGLDFDQAERLFYFWPEPFDELDPKSAVDRIDHFIKTDGAE